MGAEVYICYSKLSMSQPGQRSDHSAGRDTGDERMGQQISVDERVIFSQSQTALLTFASLEGKYIG